MKQWIEEAIRQAESGRAVEAFETVACKLEALSEPVTREELRTLSNIARLAGQFEISNAFLKRAGDGTCAEPERDNTVDIEPMTPLVGEYNVSHVQQAEAAEQVGYARDLFRQRRNNEGTRMLESALESDPANLDAVLLLRQVEQALGEKYRQQREDIIIEDLEASWATGRRSHVLLKTASFQDAPRVMRWLIERTELDGSHTTTQPNDPSMPQRVSFIIPIYNRAETLQKTFDSVLHQTCPDWEAILVDDASSDNTSQEIEALRARHGDRRIVTISLPRNHGIGAVRNIGVKRARGEYIVLLDSDDTVAPRFLEAALALADRHPEAAWIAPLTVQYGDVNRMFGFERCELRILLHRNQFTVTNLLRRDVFEMLGGMREDMRDGLVDWEFWIRAVRTGYRPIQLRDALFFYHRHEDGVTGGIRNGTRQRGNCMLQIIDSNREAYRIPNEAELQMLQSSPHIPQSLINPEALQRIEARPNPLIERSKTGVTPDIAAVNCTDMSPVVASQGHRPRILFVCHDFPPYRYAGAQLYAYHLAKELIQIGFDVRVFYPVDRSQLNGGQVELYSLISDHYEEVPVYRIVVDDTSQDIRINPQYVFDNPQVNEAFRRLLIDEKIDAVHFHLLYRLGNGLVRVAKELALVTFATLHDYWLLCVMGHMIDSEGKECCGPESPEKCATCLAGKNDSNVPEELVRFMRQRFSTNHAAYNDIDRVYSPSRFLADIHEKFGFARPEILPLGWLPIETVSRKVRNERIVFGFCGQIVYRKGLDVLVRGLLDTGRQNWELHIYGRNYQQAYFNKIMDAAQHFPNIIYKGEFTSEDLPRIYSTLDVAVVPSRRENYPLTLLEAKSAGVPVIASDVGGVREMMTLGRDGYIFPNEDVKRLSAILSNLLDNPELIDQLRSSIGRIKTIRDNAGEMAEIYREALEEVEEFDLPPLR